MSYWQNVTDHGDILDMAGGWPCEAELAVAGLAEIGGAR